MTRAAADAEAELLDTATGAPQQAAHATESAAAPHPYALAAATGESAARVAYLAAKSAIAATGVAMGGVAFAGVAALDQTDAANAVDLTAVEVL